MAPAVARTSKVNTDPRPPSRAAVPAHRIGIDVGGTFTDLVLLRGDGSTRLHKALTTPEDQSIGVMNGLAGLAAEEGEALPPFLRRLGVIVHGTTTADNTMITMSGAVTGLLTSAGHRDEIELRRGFKESIWDPAYPPPPPICPRRRRIGVPERLDADGRVVQALDEEALRQACRRLRAQKVESLAICFLFSFLNPAHETRAAEIAAEEMPGVDLSISHQVHPSAPEFERTSTTLVNAYVAPRIKRYLRRLLERLRQAGFRGELRIMQSNGGMMPVEYVERRAVAVLGSGPAGGVIAASHLGGVCGVRDFIGVDMGGTSYDVSVVRGGLAEVKAGWNWHHRYLVALPMIEVYSVGAGGGSVAQVRAGSLQVGPESAGADPGPICYGRGGQRPTVTDANLLLGFLDPNTFCNGALRLQTEGLQEAFRRQIGQPLGLDAVEAAHGVFRLINANMTNAVRRVSAQRGLDPREMALVVFGGNGAVHAGMQAAQLGIRQVIVPRSAAALSAFGLALADEVIDEVRSYVRPAALARPEEIESAFNALERQARSALGRRADIRFERLLHLCYPGQTFDMAVPLGANGARFTRATLGETIERFHQLHEQLHTYASRDEQPIVRSVRLKATAARPKPQLSRSAIRRSATRRARRGSRPVFFGDRYRPTAVYDGTALRPGHSLDGPAIVEERFTTVVLYPGHRARIDAYGNYRIAVPPPG